MAGVEQLPLAAGRRVAAEVLPALQAEEHPDPVAALGAVRLKALAAAVDAQLAVSAADPPGDCGDGLHVLVGQPAQHAPVPPAEGHVGGVQGLLEQVEQGLAAGERAVLRAHREQRVAAGLERAERPGKVLVLGTVHRVLPLVVVDDRGAGEGSGGLEDRGHVGGADQAVRFRPGEPGDVVAADRADRGARGDRHGHGRRGEHALVTGERRAGAALGAAHVLADLVQVARCLSGRCWSGMMACMVLTSRGRCS